MCWGKTYTITQSANIVNAQCASPGAIAVSEPEKIRICWNTEVSDASILSMIKKKKKFCLHVRKKGLVERMQNALLLQTPLCLALGIPQPVYTHEYIKNTVHQLWQTWLDSQQRDLWDLHHLLTFSAIVPLSMLH